LNSNLYNKTSQDIFDEKYYVYRNQGYDDREATLLAAQDARQFRTNKLYFVRQAQYALGFDDDAHTKMNFIGQKMQRCIEEEGFR